MALANKNKKKPKRGIDIELDRFESNLASLKILYEQYFVDVLPLPPDKEHKEIKKMARLLLKAPFKNSANRFRLRSLIQRFQTFETYWERVKKQREEGTYSKDKFKAELRQLQLEEQKKQALAKDAPDKGIQDLFKSYQNALKKTGRKSDNIDYNAFKKSIIKKAKTLKEQHGVKKLHYKIVMKEGRVIVKASSKD